MEKSIFWDIKNTLSYNCLFNFIVGNRGGGKTYGFKKWAIEDFLKTGAQFVYVRRYKDEISEVGKYFDDIRDEFPDVTFKVEHKRFYINDKIAGFAVVLSTSKIKKSTSYPNVNKICFDEFILDKGVHHYLHDEVTTFLELYETIARLRDVRVFFLSNAITMTNPYMLYFNIYVPYGKPISAKNDKLIELVSNKEFIAVKKETRFGKLISGTQYGDYAIENVFLRDNKAFVTHKTPNSSYYFTFSYMSIPYGVWVDYKAGVMTVSEDYDPSFKIIYAFTTNDHKPNTLLLKGPIKSILIRNFVENYKMGNVRFESMKLKNVTLELIKMSI